MGDSPGVSVSCRTPLDVSSPVERALRASLAWRVNCSHGGDAEVERDSAHRLARIFRPSQPGDSQTSIRKRQLTRSIGYGVRGGYATASIPMYLGGTVLHYGTSEGTRRTDIFTGELELGYKFGFGSFGLRPYVGLGTLLGVEESESGGGSAITLLAVPGLLATYSWAPVTLGAEVRYASILGLNDVVSVFGSAGMAF